jgi:hypothetical protein
MTGATVAKDFTAGGVVRVDASGHHRFPWSIRREYRELVRLDGVEIKANVASTHVSDAMGILDLRHANTLKIWFYEDLTPGIPPLPLLDAGLVIRVRAKENGDVDCTVKLRPCRRSQLTSVWLSTKSKGDLEFNVEEDRSGENRVLAASCQVDRDAARVASLSGAPFLLPDLLSDKQHDFLETCAPVRVNVAELTALGPIDAQRWKDVGGADFADLEARAERWTAAGKEFLEISIRADPLAADAKSSQLQELITERGLVLDASKESKTRTVLSALT